MTPAAAIQAHLGGTQRDVAERVGESAPAWSLYVRGDRQPSAAKLAAWADALDITLTYTPDGWAVTPRIAS